MIVSVQDNISTLKSIYDTIFRSYDPFEPRIVQRFARIVILYPTESYHLNYHQFAALRKAVEKKSFFISEVEQLPDPFKSGNHWRCENPSFDEYTHLPIGVENAIYSDTGTWGILLSHELHGILVCDEPFWDTFSLNYHNPGIDKAEFISYWTDAESHGGNTSWLGALLRELSV